MLYLLTIYIGFYLYVVDIYSHHSHIPTQVDIYQVDISKFSSRSQNLSGSKIPWHLPVLVWGHQQRGSEDGPCPGARWAHWPLPRHQAASDREKKPRTGILASTAQQPSNPASQTIEFPQNKIYGRIRNYLLMADGGYIINLLKQKTTFSLIKR